MIVIRAVAIVLAIGLVVFLVVGKQVGEREAVMDGDVVDASARRAIVMVEKVGRSGHAATRVADQFPVASPIAAQGAAKAVIPLRPMRRKTADLIAAGPTSQGSATSLTRARTGSWRDCIEERSVAVEPRGPRASVVARSKRKPSMCRLRPNSAANP